MSNTALNKLIEDFSHLPLDDKEYVIDVIKKQLIETKRNAIAKQQLKGKGDERLADYMRKVGHEDIGSNRKYETMVFPSRKSGDKCCPYVAKDWSNVDFDSYNSAEDAFSGHYKMCLKWAKK